jgi:hypothetical protein
MLLGRWKDRRTFWGWACGGVLGALLTAATAPAQTAPAKLPEGVAQPAAAAPPKSAAPKEAAPAEAAPWIPVGTDGGPGCAAGDGAAEGPKSVFANVPPLPQTLPRPGVFFMPPGGPGYYSLWDLISDKYREQRPPQPYSAISPDIYPFFMADFRYLDKPDAELQSPFDALKRMRIGDDCLMLSVGGEERIRQMNEVNGRLNGRDDNYQLFRSRVYADLWYQDKIRIYVEYYDAEIYNENQAPRPIDVNRSDFLDFFADVKLLELGGAPVYVRGGRQELCFGSQRLISPLDWANTRRTFEGVQLFRYSEKFDASFFWTQPVIVDPKRFDSVDDKQNFSGAWLTYRPMKGQAVDLYYLDLDNANHNVLGQAVGRAGRVTGSFNTSTVGARYAGNYEDLLFDFEGMYQFGNWSNQGISAGAYTAALGWNFSKLPMTPQLWAGYDFASGDHNPGGSDTHGTFNQLFPFGHYYFGFLDLVGRQNIEDLNFQAVVWPMKWVTCVAQYHLFRLDSARDALYGPAGQVIRSDPTGRAGRDVGNELDWWVNFHLTQNQDLWVGWSKLYEGSYLKKTGPGPSPELFYVQYSFRW